MIYRYESGLSDITGDSLKALSEKLGVNSDYLLGLSDDPNLQTRESVLSEDERTILELFRREGWQGVARLSVEKLSEPR
jgi:transcriptional regulator with XRE-family HTH domain